MTKRIWIYITITIIAVIALATLLILRADTDTDSNSTSSPPSTSLPTEQPDQTGEPITLEGQMVCLPHKNTEGPQTLECAFGLKDESGEYFALQDTASDYSNITKAANGDVVRVSGLKLSQPSETYQSDTLIKVESLEKLN